ncbi:transcriptional regulator, TetR family [Pseudovibrio denitrificans]|uniref:Transcriptional regulator, TetR family n=1 Tax=Pseudovibrio denitrificans TaxID=258256 RepID=A0A1I7AP65_9HYPH|nr:TetR family transcriptional regulator [Pseudovibrio denitrificans]SFT76676.1 transcriptional regulator, TetR family [Pseudovibrio denitrificans]
MTAKETKAAEKSRDAEATRAAILSAAQKHFAASGFDGVGVRDIARDAGVNAALINRYFGSKEQLFFKATQSEDHLLRLTEGDRETFGQRIAERLATRPLKDDQLDSTLVMIRSVSSNVVGPELCRRANEEYVGKLAEWLGGENADQRAALIFSEILGFDMMRRMIGTTALNDEKQTETIAYLAKSIQSYVDG